MKKSVIIAAMACTMTLAACGSQEAQNVEDAYDNRADIIDNQAANLEEAGANAAGAVEATTANAVDRLENTADAVRAEGDARANAIDAAK